MVQRQKSRVVSLLEAEGYIIIPPGGSSQQGHSHPCSRSASSASLTPHSPDSPRTPRTPGARSSGAGAWSSGAGGDGACHSRPAGAAAAAKQAATTGAKAAAGGDRPAGSAAAAAPAGGAAGRVPGRTIMLRKANSLTMLDVLPPLSCSHAGSVAAPGTPPAAVRASAAKPTARLSPPAATPPERARCAAAAHSGKGAGIAATAAAAAACTPTPHTEPAADVPSHAAAAPASPTAPSSALLPVVQQAPAVATAAASASVTLLGVSSQLPPGMARPVWALAGFRVVRHLYEGYASNVYRALDLVSGQTVALKKYHLSRLNAISHHQVLREARLHLALRHEHIITLYAAFQQGSEIVLVQEFAEGGDLFAFMSRQAGKMTERMAVALVLQPFLAALHYMHTCGVAHRDIKPENVLFTADTVLKIADFGLAIDLREERAVTRVGTLDYMAPEVLRCPLKRLPGDNKDRPELQYDRTVDTWAVGVLAYELLVGSAPFACGIDEGATTASILAGKVTYPSRMSDSARAFISSCLELRPAERPSVLEVLQHAWIKSFQRQRSVRVAHGRPSVEMMRLPPASMTCGFISPSDQAPSHLI